MDILKHFDSAVDFTAKFAIDLASRRKGISAGDYLTGAVIIIAAVMMSPSLTSLVAVGAIFVLLLALRQVISGPGTKGRQ